MKKIVIYLVPAIFIVGCSREISFDELAEGGGIATETLPRDLKNVVYDEVLGSWVMPQNDPYTLENFQTAYNNLSSGNSHQTLTRAQTVEISGMPKLEATHLALKMYPKTEEELRDLEQTEGIKVSYLPFNLVLLTQEEIRKLEASNKSAASKSRDERRYTITHNDYVATDGVVVDSVTYVLPVLYAVWPVNKPLPDWIDCETDYEVFLPGDKGARTRTSGLSVETLKALEDEAIMLALGEMAIPQPSTRASTTSYHGALKTRDNFWMTTTDLPLANVKIRIQLGSSIVDVGTDSNGEFRFPASLSSAYSLSRIYQDPVSGRWTITGAVRELNPIVVGMGTLNSIATTTSAPVTFVSTLHSDAVHRAVNFFYGSSHSVPVYNYRSGIRIIAASDIDDKYNGYFAYSRGHDGYITIYNSNANYNGRKMGTVLHELGHLVHYHMRGDFANYDQVALWIKEAWASYAGWELAESYYASLGRTRIPMSGWAYVNFSRQDRQDWTNTFTGDDREYGPRIVDLRDDFNQRELGSTHPNDDIENVPYTVINRLAREARRWDSFKPILDQYVGIYYTQTELNNYCEFYD